MTRSGAPAPWLETPARHLYVAHFRVRFNELDALGHVNNAVYLIYLEQTAIDHAAAEGYSADALREIGGVFIARRHEITYLRPARENDLLRVTTWPFDFQGARGFRAYEICRLQPLEAADQRDGLREPDDPELANPEREIIVTAETEWAYVDPQTGRPRRIPPPVRDAFLVLHPPDSTPSE